MSSKREDELMQEMTPGRSGVPALPKPSPYWSELEFRRLLEKLPAGAYTCDPDGLITYFNQRAADLWGRAPKLNDPEDRFCGSLKLFLPDGSPLPHDECWMALALRTNTEYDGHELVIERPDGHRVTALAHANPVRDEAGRLSGAVNVLVDISDRKRAEDSLREADRSKDDFLATLAHELRNPLAPIRNAVEILQLQGLSAPESRWAVDVIDRQMRQMTRLVDDLLDVSRITRNKLELRRERIELAAVLQAAVETCRPLVEAGGQELAVDLPAVPVHLDADSTRLAQALANLLNNAAKYTGRGGRIWLSAERQGSDVVVSVRDTGCGIPAEMLPRVFEMFTQVDRSLARSQGGLGIGLALTRRLIEMHGGTVEVRSDGPGKGSEFTLRLPVLCEPAQQAHPANGRGERAAAAACLRILVVDDNRDAADSLGMFLSLMGNDVHTAYDGLEAVAMAGDLRPDVVMLDIGLPKIDGYEAARRIRRQPRGQEMVLIALTGWGQDEDRQRSKEAGFDHHLVKPVDPAVLLELLTSLARAAAH